MVRALTVSVFACYLLSQSPTFEAASVRPSKAITGHDGSVTTDPGRLIAKNATLKRLIFEAYRVPYSQITGGPAWLNSDEYDIDAKSETPATPEQLQTMLRTLLTERFGLTVHTERKERSVFTLAIAKGGARLHSNPSHSWRFHGDLAKFADILAIQLTIPISSDPATPTRASGSPAPVLNKTGLEGTYDLSLDLKTDPAADSVTIWQRALQEQLGLKLSSTKAQIPILVIDHASKLPSPN